MANLNLNKVIIAGRLTADPQLKKTNSDVSVCSFTIAVNRRYQKDGEQTADFLNVTAWKKTAEVICSYFRKASSICVVGSLQTRSWEKDGQKRFATEIVADEAYFVDAKSENPLAVQQSAPVYSSPAAVPGQSYMPDGYGVQSPMTQAAPQFEDITGDDELPF